MDSDTVASTPRLTLRLHRESDLDRLVAIYSRPDVARYLLEEPWTVESGRVQDAERRTVELGWTVDPEHGGSGYATEAVSAGLRIAFGQDDVHRVVAQMDARNASSARLATRVGMRQEAHHRQDFWSKGEWTDSLVFAVLAGEHPPR